MKLLLVVLAAVVVQGQDDSEGKNHLELAARPLSGEDIQHLFEMARPGTDFPNHHTIPETDFTCQGNGDDVPDKYGYFADTSAESRCQVIRRCIYPSGDMYSFLCPNGTLFNNVYLVCDWWYNVDCSLQDARANYANKNLYKDPKTLLHVAPPENFVLPWWVTTDDTTDDDAAA